MKGELFEVVRPLTEPETSTSELDEYQSSTMHPLSRVRISFGNVAGVRAAALSFLARSAMEAEQRSYVVATAFRWLGAESEPLQRTGSAVLTLPHMESPDLTGADWVGHPSPWVRRAAATLLSKQQPPDLVTLERLASDPHQLVRIGVVHALEGTRDTAPEEYERIRSRLLKDGSAIIRAVAADILDYPTSG